MRLPRPFRGFPWWLPLLSAAAAAAITALIINSADPVWAADSRVWVPDERLPAQHVQAILDEPQTFADAMELTLWEQSAADLAAATSMDVEGTLITLRVETHNPALAEQMAASLAEIVVDKCYERNPGPAHPETLGVTWPGAQRVAPSPSGAAALAGLGGLLGGLALAAALGRTRPPSPPSTLALLARQGWRPLAIIPAPDSVTPAQAGTTPAPPPVIPAQAGTTPPPTAQQLADEIEAAPNHGPVTAFLPLHHDADPEIPARQAARALAGRGRNILWLDARPPTPTLLTLPNNLLNPPTPFHPIDPDAPIPTWLQGLPIPPKPEQLRTLIANNKTRFDAILLLLPPVIPAPDSVIPAQAGTAPPTVIPAQAGTTLHTHPPFPNSSLPPSRGEARWGVGRNEHTTAPSPTTTPSPSTPTPAPSSATPTPSSATPTPSSATPAPSSATPAPPPATPAPPPVTPAPPSVIPAQAGTLADRIALTARDDYHPAPSQIAQLAAQLPNNVPILGIALTHASPDRAKDFQAAADHAQENSPK